MDADRPGERVPLSRQRRAELEVVREQRPERQRGGERREARAREQAQTRVTLPAPEGSEDGDRAGGHRLDGERGAEQRPRDPRVPAPVQPRGEDRRRRRERDVAGEHAEGDAGGEEDGRGGEQGAAAPAEPGAAAARRHEPEEGGEVEPAQAVEETALREPAGEPAAEGREAGRVEEAVDRIGGEAFPHGGEGAQVVLLVDQGERREDRRGVTQQEQQREEREEGGLLRPRAGRLETLGVAGRSHGFRAGPPGRSRHAGPGA
ncbi:MAG: hypothetical protein BWX64_02877 [Acidobacteria bacterium ADurb.Bin051]|nr:MAG: hypothetical protein BWX64_02877 [Acidobacteria bacterium ADurb.Bin051]